MEENILILMVGESRFKTPTINFIDAYDCRTLQVVATQVFMATALVEEHN